MALNDHRLEERNIYAITVFFISVLMLLLSCAIGIEMWKGRHLTSASFLIPVYGLAMCLTYLVIPVYFHPLLFQVSGTQEDFARKMDSDARAWVTSAASSVLLGYVCFSAMVDPVYLWAKIPLALALHEMSLQNTLEECRFSVPIGSDARNIWITSMRLVVLVAILACYIVYDIMT